MKTSPAARFRFLVQPLASFLILLFSIALPGLAQAGGLEWLAAQNSADGSYTQSADIATAYQASAETLRTFQFFSHSPAGNAYFYLDNAASSDTESLSRRLLARIANGQNATPLLAELLTRQNADGGFGDLPGYESTVLDSAFALEALAAVGASALQPAGGAVYFLLQRQQNGAWNEGEVYSTALAMHSLWLYKDAFSPVPSALTQSRDFLLGQRGGNLWPEAFQSTLALIALVPFVPDLSLVDESMTALRSLQAADGSWGDDVYTTALALRAIRMYEGRQGGATPATGSISGRISNADRSAVPAGAVARLSPGGRSVMVESDGRFLVPGLSPGRYTVVAEASGYASLSKIADIQAGTVADAGVFALPLLTDPSQPSQLTLYATVLDGVSNQPISGATVSLSGSDLSQVTQIDGTAVFAGITSMAFQVSVSADGYTGNTYAVNAPGFGELNYTFILLPAGSVSSATETVLSGQVTDAGSQPVAGAQVTIPGTTYAAITDTAGHYQLSNIGLLHFDLSITAAGYSGARYQVELPAHGSYTQNARLVPTPNQLTLYATVLDGLSNQPVSGATVSLSGSSLSQVTQTDGTAVLAGITSMAFQVSISAEGHVSNTYNINAPGFGELAYTFVLPPAGGDPAATETTLSGQVIDAGSQPVVGAQVVIPGTAYTAVTDTAGHYQLTGIASLHFDLSVTAAGYSEARYQVELPAHGSYTQNVQLAAAASGSFQIVSLYASQPSVSLNGTARFVARIANLGGTEGKVLALGEIFDAQNQPVATVQAYQPGTQIVSGELTIPANGQAEVDILWNSAQWSAGEYRLEMHLVEPGTIRSQLPTGNILAKSNSAMTVLAQKAISGRIDFNPPLVQMGAGTPVQLSVFLANAGNTAFDTESLRLSIIQPTTNTTLHSATQTSPALKPMEFAIIDFGSWIPTESGELQILIAAEDSATTGEITGTLYVGNKASGVFTVDRNTVPAGHSTVQAAINITGVDVTRAAVNDPLFYAVQEAVKRGGQYTATGAVNWTRASTCSGCHIQSQSLMGLVESLGKADIDINAANFLSNTITGSQRDYGGTEYYYYYGYYKSTQTILNIWALSAWREAPHLYTPMYKAGQYFLGNRQTASGGQIFWTHDYSTAWWNSNIAATASVVKGLASLIRNGPAFSQQSRLHDHLQQTVLGMGSASFADMETAPDGNLYAIRGNQIVRVNLADNSVTALPGTLPSNRSGLAIVADGTLYVSTSSGQVLKIDPATGTSTDISAHAGLSGHDLRDVETGPDGSLYFSDYNYGKIWRLRPDEAAQALVSGLRYPYGLAFDEAGKLSVSVETSSYLYGIIEVAADGSRRTAADGLPIQAQRLVAVPGGGWYATLGTSPGNRAGQYGIYHVSAEGLIERVFDGTEFKGIVYTGGKLLALNEKTAQLSEIRSIPLDISALAAMQASVEGAARYFLANVSATTDNVYQAQRLIGMAEALTVVSDANLRAQLETAIASQAQLLRDRQRNDGLDAAGEAKGGWGRYVGYPSDPLVTAMAGIALDYTNPSASDPMVRKAIRYLLSTQTGDGSWLNINNGLTTRLAATSFVMAYMPRALVRLGGLDVDLYADFPANIQPGAFSAAPAQSLALPDGSIRYQWKFTGVTYTGQAINFPLTLQDMRIGEQRPVADAAWLEFANDFTNSPLRLDLAIPVVHAENLLTLSAALDKTAYGPGESAQIQAAVGNNSEAPSTAYVVSYTLLDANGQVVAELPAQPGASLPGGNSANFTSAWNTGTTLAGEYSLRVTLTDAYGDLAGIQNIPFTLTAGPATILSLRASTDRPVYHSTDTVEVQSLAQNQSANVVISGARLEIQVQDPSGQTVFSEQQALNALAPSGSQTRLSRYAFQAATEGGYTVIQRILSSTGQVLAQASAVYQVKEDPRLSLGAQVSVALSELFQGDTQTANATVTNSGTLALNAQAMRWVLTGVDSSTIAASAEFTLDLAGHGSQSISQAFTVSENLAPGSYGAVLQAWLNNAWQTLGYALFTVKEKPIRLDAGLSVGGHGAVLVLLDNCTGRGKDGEHHACLGTVRTHCDGEDDEDREGRSGHDRRDEADDDDDEQDEDGHCDCADPHGGQSSLAAQQAFLESLLTAHGWAYTIVSNEDDFTREFRSGAYSLYALFSEQEKLSEQVQDELTEAVYRGEGLLVAGAHDNRNHLRDALGIKYRGKWSKVTGLTLTNSPLHNNATASFQGDAQALRIDLAGAQSVGDFVLKTPQCESIGEGKNKRQTCVNTGTAITTRQYGEGASVGFSFDLLAQATQAGENSLFAELILAGLQAVEPLPPNQPGSLLPLTLSLTNQGIATPGRALIDACPTCELLSSQAETQTDGSLLWPFNLAEAQQENLSFWLRLPWEAPSLTLNALVQTGVAPNWRDYTTLTQNLDILPQPAMPEALGQFAQLANQDKSYRQAQQRLKQAARWLEQGKYEEALKELLKAVAQLPAKPEAHSPRLLLDHLIRSVARLTNLATAAQ